MQCIYKTDIYTQAPPLGRGQEHGPMISSMDEITMLTELQQHWTDTDLVSLSIAQKSALFRKKE